MLNKPFRYFAIGALIAACFGGYFVWTRRPSTAATAAAYNPLITPANKDLTSKPRTHRDTSDINSEDFVREINNKYFTLKPGMKFTYQNGAGTERVEITVTSETRELMGVTTRGVRITERSLGAVKDDTIDWYAQDKTGNVWFFGEADNIFRNKKLVSPARAWEAGVNGAKPGVIMRADPWVGATYPQEYHGGRADDMAAVIATDKKITVPYGTFENCLQIRDSSSVENEYKYYCPAVGFLVREETINGAVKSHLIGVSTQ